MPSGGPLAVLFVASGGGAAGLPKRRRDCFEGARLWAARRGVCDGGWRLWLLRGKAAPLRSRRSVTRLTGASGAPRGSPSGRVLCGASPTRSAPVPKSWLALRPVEERSRAWGLAFSARSSSSSVGSWFRSSWTVVLSCLGFCRPGFLERGRSVEVEPRQEGSG